MLCLFDLDGTLIDSEIGILGCVRHALTQLGVEHPAEMRHWIGPPLRHSFAPLLDHDHDRIELAVEYYHQRFHAIGWREHTVALPEGRWRDVLTGREVEGGSVRLADLLATLPVALLTPA